MDTGEGTFRVMLRMQVKPGMEDEFERTWAAVGAAVTENRANLGQWLARSHEEPGVYYIASDWVDEPRFRAFEHSGAHVRHRAALQPLRVGGSMTTARIVRFMPGRAVRPNDRRRLDGVRRGLRAALDWLVSGLAHSGMGWYAPPWQWTHPADDDRR
jgi:heme-degrading monooxygenase HmoA